MLDLILIILLLVSLSKPEVLLSKKLKEAANDEQKNILASNFRKLYAVIIATFESMAVSRYNGTIGALLTIVCVILLFKVLPIPSITPDPVNVRFSTFDVNVYDFDEITVSVPSDAFSVTTSFTLST